MIWLCVVLLLSLSIDERRSRNPCAVLADTRRASTFALAAACAARLELQRINVLARPIQFSKNRPRFSLPRSSSVASKRPLTPAWVRGPKTGVDRVQGNLPTLLSPLRAVNIFFSSQAVSHMSAKPPPESDVGNLPSWCPTWEPGKPGTWGQPQSPNGEPRLTNPKAKLDTTRRRWACQPRLPAARERFRSLRWHQPRRASRHDCLTYGRPTATRIPKHNRGDGGPSTTGDQLHRVSRDLEQNGKIGRQGGDA